MPKDDAETTALKAELNTLIEKIKEDQKKGADENLTEKCSDLGDIPKIRLSTKKYLKGHINKVNSVHYSGDSRHCVTGSLDGKLIIWDTWTGNKVQVIPLRSSWVMSVAFAPSGNFVACGGMDNMCTVYDVNNRDATGAAKMTRELAGYEGFLSSCRFLDDSHIITGSGDMKICHWDLEVGKRTSEFNAHNGDVVSISLSPDGKTYVTGSVDRTCKLWDIREEKPKQTFFGHESDVNSVCYHPSAQAFATGSEDKSARLFDLRSDQQLAQYAPPNKTCGFTSCDPNWSFVEVSGPVPSHGDHCSPLLFLHLVRTTDVQHWARLLRAAGLYDGEVERNYEKIPAGRLLAILMLITGYFLTKCVLVSVMTWEIICTKARRLAYLDQLQNLVSHLRFAGANDQLILRTEKYYDVLWTMKNGVIDVGSLNELPLPLQLELLFDINVFYLSKSLLFREKSEAFLRQLSLLMTNVFLLPGDTLYYQNVVKAQFVCVTSGVLETLSDEDDESPIISFTKGTVLGELALLYSLPAKATIKAATFVELQVLERTRFLKTMVEQPFIYKEIRTELNSRIQHAREIQLAMKNSDNDRGDVNIQGNRYRPMKMLKDQLNNVITKKNILTDDSHLYYRDKDELKEKFQTQYLELYVISDNVTMISHPRICWRSQFPWILEPDTDFLHFWEQLHFAMVIYVCLMLPTFSFFEAERINMERIITTIVIAAFVLDIYFQATTAIVTKTTRIDSVKTILEYKMSTAGFYVDIISIFPINMFVDLMDVNKESVVGQIGSIFPVFRIWRIWTYLSKQEENIWINLKLMRFVKYILTLCILCFWSGCILYLEACPRRLCQEGHWMKSLAYLEMIVKRVGFAKHLHPKWFSFYLGTGVFIALGNSELIAGPGDIFYIIFLIIFGSIMVSLFVADICGVYNLMSRRRIGFQNIIQSFNKFLETNHLSSSIKQRVTNFFRTQWYYNEGVMTKDLMHNLPYTLRQELLGIELLDTLKKTPLFQMCDQDFIQMLATKANVAALPSNEIVYHTGDMIRDMYIIEKGYCKALSHTGAISKALHPGDYFGDMEMLFGLPKVHTVVTTTNCVLINVEYRVIVQCLSIFPDTEIPIKRVIDDPQIRAMTEEFEVAKQISGKLGIKKGKLAHIWYKSQDEIKNSFTMVLRLEGEERYNEAFERYGLLRHLRFAVIPITITPTGIFLKLWCVVRCVIALYYIIFAPYDIAIKRSKLTGVNKWVDYICYLDLIFMSYVGYYDERNLLISHPLYTIKHYLTHSFLLDLIAVFPTESLLELVNTKADIDVWRLNRILQIYRIITTFYYFEEDILHVSTVVILLKFLPIAFTCVNLAACLVFHQSCSVIAGVNSTFAYTVNCTQKGWLSTTDFHSTSPIEVYTLASYWMFSTFMGVGLLPVEPQSYLEVFLCIILSIVGVTYFGFVYGYITSSKSITNQSVVEFKENLSDLKEFLYQENVDPILTYRTVKYFDYVWKKTYGSNPQKICRLLNNALMEDTLVFMYEKTLREMPLFEKLEKSFIRIITQHLQEMYFLKGDTIVQSRDIQPNIYIIYKGKVDVLSSYNEMITCMGPGGLFGNFTGKVSACSKVTITASRNVDLLIVPSNTFFSLVRFYPRVYEHVMSALQDATDYIMPTTILDEIIDVSDESDSDNSKSISVMSEISKGATSSTGSTSISSQASRSNISTSTTNTVNQFPLRRILIPGSNASQSLAYVMIIASAASFILSSYKLTTGNQCFFLYILHAILDTLFYFNIWITMHSAYVNRRGDFSSDLKRCRKHYMSRKFRMWLDIIVNLPVDPLALAFNDPLKALRYLQSLRMGRVLYIVDYYKKTSTFFTNSLTTLQVVNIFTWVSVTVHAATCFWLGCIILLEHDDTYRYKVGLKLGISDVLSTTNNTSKIPKQFIFKWNYLSSLYMVITAITMTGFDEISIRDIRLLLLLIFYNIMGKIGTGVLISRITMIMYSHCMQLDRYEESLRRLTDVLKNQGLSDFQLEKFWVYKTKLWNSEKGRQLPVLVKELSYVRKCEVVWAMFGQHLRSSYVFKDAGEPFLRQLSVTLNHMVFFPGNYIVQDGDTDASMYFVHRGRVAVLSVCNDLTETIHETLVSGDVFGTVQGLHRGVPHVFSYRAQTKVSILILSLESWAHLMPFFPDATKLIYEKAEKNFSTF